MTLYVCRKIEFYECIPSLVVPEVARGFMKKLHVGNYGGFGVYKMDMYIQVPNFAVFSWDLTVDLAYTTALQMCTFLVLCAHFL